MKVFFAGAGPGDPELLTLKTRRLMDECPVCVYAGSLISPDIIALLPEACEKHDSARLNLDETTDLCRLASERGVDLLRLHTGDPSIYGAIREQIFELNRLGIAWEVVPGVSSFQATAAVLGAELTAPEISQTVILSRVAGRTPVPEEQDLEKLAATRSTLCLFLSVHGIREICQRLTPFYGADCPAAVVRQATWPDQLIVRGTLADIAEKTIAAKIGKTAMIVVGWALGEEKTVSKLYDAGFAHGYRPAQKPTDAAAE